MRVRAGLRNFRHRPSKGPTASPTELPAVSPTTKAPTSSPLIPTGGKEERLLLSLSRSTVTAGESIAVFSTLFDANGIPIEPPPTITYQILFVEVLGTVPILFPTAQGANVDTFQDTRGVYTAVTANVDGFPSVAETADFIVFPPASVAPMKQIYGKLSTSVNGIVQSVDILQEATSTNDVGTIQVALDELRAQRSNVNLEKLRRTAVCAPDEGFFPTPSQMTAQGYPATDDDIALQSVIQSMLANIENFSFLLDEGEDLALMNQSNEQAALLLDEYHSLTPSVHGWVLIQEDLNYLYASVIPKFVHAFAGALDAKILEEDIGVTRHLDENVVSPNEPSSSGRRRAFGLGSLAGAAVAAKARGKIMNDVYVPILVDLYRSVAIMAIGNLLQGFTNSVGLAGIKTGGSLSFNAFQLRNSWLEVNGANARFPDRTDVTLIGTTAVATVEELIKSFDPRGVKNLEDLYNFYEGVVSKIEDTASAAEKANQIADGIGGSCILGGDEACVQLLFDNGFEVVNTCSGFVCFPQPVLFMVKNLDTGGFSQGLYNFAFT